MAALGAGLLAAGCAADFTERKVQRDFAELVALSAARLELSRQVALTKWDSGQPVADPPSDPREHQVIADASREAGRRGLPEDFASAFFTDQIEASKLVQFSLMAHWRRGARVPREPRADLRRELRPALDRLQPKFIDELLATSSARADAQCGERLAYASEAYVNERRLSTLHALALDRALARVCTE